MCPEIVKLTFNLLFFQLRRLPLLLLYFLEKIDRVIRQRNDHRDDQRHQIKSTIRWPPNRIPIVAVDKHPQNNIEDENRKQTNHDLTHHTQQRPFLCIFLPRNVIIQSIDDHSIDYAQRKTIIRAIQHPVFYIRPYDPRVEHYGNRTRDQNQNHHRSHRGPKLFLKLIAKPNRFEVTSTHCNSL